MDAERHSTPLEERVVRTLEERGLLRRRRHSSGNGRGWRAPARLAAAAALLLLGGAMGALIRPSLEEQTAAPADDAPRFALLLYDVAAGAGVREMSLWARELQQRGHYITGEKLAPDRVVVSPSGEDVGGGAMTGFFVVSATDVREAESIARSSPHVRHGGRIVVRPIEHLERRVTSEEKTRAHHQS